MMDIIIMGSSSPVRRFGLLLAVVALVVSEEVSGNINIGHPGVGPVGHPPQQLYHQNGQVGVGVGVSVQVKEPQSRIQNLASSTPYLFNGAVEGNPTIYTTSSSSRPGTSLKILSNNAQSFNSLFYPGLNTLAPTNVKIVHKGQPTPVPYTVVTSTNTQQQHNHNQQVLQVQGQQQQVPFPVSNTPQGDAPVTKVTYISTVATLANQPNNQQPLSSFRVTSPQGSGIGTARPQIFFQYRNNQQGQQQSPLHFTNNQSPPPTIQSFHHQFLPSPQQPTTSSIPQQDPRFPPIQYHHQVFQQQQQHQPQFSIDRSFTTSGNQGFNVPASTLVLRPTPPNGNPQRVTTTSVPVPPINPSVVSNTQYQHRPIVGPVGTVFLNPLTGQPYLVNTSLDDPSIAKPVLEGFGGEEGGLQNNQIVQQVQQKPPIPVVPVPQGQLVGQAQGQGNFPAQYAPQFVPGGSASESQSPAAFQGFPGGFPAGGFPPQHGQRQGPPPPPGPPPPGHPGYPPFEIENGFNPNFLNPDPFPEGPYESEFANLPPLDPQDQIELEAYRNRLLKTGRRKIGRRRRLRNRNRQRINNTPGGVVAVPVVPVAVPLQPTPVSVAPPIIPQPTEDYSVLVDPPNAQQPTPTPSQLVGVVEQGNSNPEQECVYRTENNECVRIR